MSKIEPVPHYPSIENFVEDQRMLHSRTGALDDAWWNTYTANAIRILSEMDRARFNREVEAANRPCSAANPIATTRID